MATDRTGHSRLLGSGFLIIGSESVGLAATAAHVLDEAAQAQGTGPARSVLGHARPDIATAPEKLRILWMPERSVAHALVVHGFAVRGNAADVALVWVSFQESTDNVIFPRLGFGFDHQLPSIGAAVVAAGFDLEMSSQVVNGATRRVELRADVLLRRGTVTDVDEDGRYMGIGRNFSTTIPFPPGLSGSPVVDEGEAGAPVVLRGLVASSGFCPPEAERDIRIPGAGRCVSAAELLRLPIDARRSLALVDLVRRGHLLDASGRLARTSQPPTDAVTEIQLTSHD
jgi:hypothetical protein